LSQIGLTLISFGIGLPTPLNDFRKIIGMNLCITPSSLSLLIALVRHCALRPEGTLCYLDEMVSWVNKITDKKSGEDRASWLMGYNTVNTGLVAGLFLHDGSPIVIHHSTGGTSKPSTMCNLLRASTNPLAATIIANAEPRG
jgi:hypothetical protein